jgi:hypothetical protein
MHTCPNCKKEVENLTPRETSYEYFEFKCDACWALIDAAYRLKNMKEHYVPKVVKIVAEGGRYLTVYGTMGRKKSGRPDGLWMLGAFDEKDLFMYWDCGGKVQVVTD